MQTLKGLDGVAWNLLPGSSICCQESCFPLLQEEEWCAYSLLQGCGLIEKHVAPRLLLLRDGFSSSLLKMFSTAENKV